MDDEINCEILGCELQKYEISINYHSKNINYLRIRIKIKIRTRIKMMKIIWFARILKNKGVREREGTRKKTKKTNIIELTYFCADCAFSWVSQQPLHKENMKKKKKIISDEEESGRKMKTEEN